MAHVRFCRRADGRETIRLASQERFLGEHRCGDCNLWCSKVGLGGQCSGCDDILTVSDLIGFDLNSKEVPLV